MIIHPLTSDAQIQDNYPLGHGYCIYELSSLPSPFIILMMIMMIRREPAHRRKNRQRVKKQQRQVTTKKRKKKMMVIFHDDEDCQDYIIFYSAQRSGCSA